MGEKCEKIKWYRFSNPTCVTILIEQCEWFNHLPVCVRTKTQTHTNTDTVIGTTRRLDQGRNCQMFVTNYFEKKICSTGKRRVSCLFIKLMRLCVFDTNAGRDIRWG